MEEKVEDAASAPGEAISPDLLELGEIIRAYSAATAELQNSHELLQKQVMQLTGELQRKNSELSETVTQVSSLKNYLAGIIESSADGIIAIDMEHRVMAWNPAANVLAAIGGREPIKWEGLPLLEAIPPACRELTEMLIRSLEQDRPFSGIETRLVDATGRTRYFSVSASPIRSQTEDGSRTVGAVQIFSELTEIRELEDRANRQDRLAALGEMAAGVAHEIRNPLGGIELYASSLRRKFGEGSAEHATCGKIIDAAARLNRIVTDMLTFTRGRAPQKRRASLDQVIRTALDMAAKVLDERAVAVDVFIPPDCGPLTLDPDQIAQAALNILLNAAQAMEKGGRISITGEFRREQDGERWLAVRFADEGPGIPDAAKGKIFDPFFTLRKDGTGLGLAIVHKIIQDHGGHVIISDNVPNGTVVELILPAGPNP